MPARSLVAGAAAVAALLGASLVGCASSRELFAGILPGGSRPSLYYVAVGALPVYREPGRGVLAHLSLDEKVLRSRVDAGWAFVRVESTGLEGWVDNAKLAWRAPSTAGSEASGVEPVGSAATPEAIPAEAASQPTQPDPEPAGADDAPDGSSVFDPY